MERKLKIKKCPKCGTTIQLIKDHNDSNCEIKCCEKMITLSPNTTDAAKEKHVPNILIEEDTIKVKIDHVMEEEHYIEWIAMVTETEEHFIDLKPGSIAEAEFQYQKNAKIYAYCNKHDLWMKQID